MCGKHSLTKFANFLIVLRAEIVTTFGSKMVYMNQWLKLSVGPCIFTL